jgi:hypothetical protein
VKLFNKRLHSLRFIFNHVRFFRFLTERILYLNKKGKSWIANNLVKEIKNLFLPYRVPLPIALPWKSINENTLQLSEPNKDCANEAPSNIVNKNKECQRISRNIGHQKTEVNAECVKFHWLQQWDA